jgi:hypothetical protein
MLRCARVQSVAALAASVIISSGFQVPAKASCGGDTAPNSSGGCPALTQPQEDRVTNERADTRLGERPWISETWQSSPFMVKQSAPTYTVRTSLAHYFTFDAYRRIAHASLSEQGLTPPEIRALVRSTAPRAPVDLWTTLDFDRSMDEGLIRGGVGADVTLGRGSVVGLAFERGELSNGDDERVITYFKRRLATGLTWRLQGGWGTVTVESAEAASIVQNGYLKAGLEKAWASAGIEVRPSLDVMANLAQLEDDDGARRSVETQILLAQRVSRSFEIDPGKRLEPFVVIRQSINARDGADAGQELESGLKLDQRDQFSLSASTAFKRRDETSEPDVSGKLQLKMPFN